MDFRAGLAALVFNAVMLVLALWQGWSVAVVLLSYVIESIFVMVAYQIHAAGKGGKISQKNRNTSEKAFKNIAKRHFL